MSRFFKWFKEKFLTLSFITFCIIGVLNTIINSLVMKGVLASFDLMVDTDISTKESGAMYYVSMGVATLLAFVVASIFSYFANAKFTYKAKRRDGRTPEHPLLFGGIADESRKAEEHLPKREKVEYHIRHGQAVYRLFRGFLPA